MGHGGLPGLRRYLSDPPDSGSAADQVPAVPATAAETRRAGETGGEMTDPVKTVVDEANAFMDRHADRVPPGSPALTIGGLTWGLMRAIAECPTCPGVFRAPAGHRLGFPHDWDALRCPSCELVWSVKR